VVDATVQNVQRRLWNPKLCHCVVSVASTFYVYCVVRSNLPMYCFECWRCQIWLVLFFMWSSAQFM